MTFIQPSLWQGRVYSRGWQPSPQTRDILEPATGALLTRSGVANATHVREAAEAAATAQPAWAAQNFENRAAIFRNAAALLLESRSSVAEWITRETGATQGKSQFEISVTLRALHEAASMPSQPQGLVLPSMDGRMSFARRVPLGVVGVISPFNFPLYLSMRAVAPALALGNAVVLKPDLRTPVTGGLLLAQLYEKAGLPANLLHVLPGEADAGEALCIDPQIAMIQFTGSTQTGRRVGALAGEHLKKVSLELGGKNSLIVLDDADLDVAASNAAWGAYLHQGQICMAGGRVLVQSGIVAEFITRLRARVAKLSLGDPATELVALGPVITQQQRDRIHAIVQESIAAGAKLEAGGIHHNLFYRPTILSGVRPGMRAFEEEIFGPVICITAFDHDEQAIALANQTEYGLAAAVLSKSLARATSVGNRLRTGILHINDQTVNDDVVNPFGGRGKSGNGTNIGGPANCEEFTQWQWVTIKGSATSYPI